MNAFEFSGVPRVVFGRGGLARVGQLAAELGRAAVVVTNLPDAERARWDEQLREPLQKAGVRCVSWSQRGEPYVEHVEQVVELARREACDLVIGFGGGSALDAAKAAAGVLANGGGPLDYMEVVGAGRPLTKPAMPWIAMPTTAGTGAEVTRNAVIGCAEKRFKASLRSHHLLARVALVDAELGVTVPADVTASSGMDALCQLIESYTSNRAQPMTDALALQGISLAAPALPRVFADGGDLDAREDMALAALLSGIALANAGLGAVHGFAAPLGANLPIPHGTVCAALLPHVMAANVDALLAESADHPALRRYATIGKTLSRQGDMPDTVAIESAIQIVSELTVRLRIPRLNSFGLTSEKISVLAELAEKASSMRYNPVVLSQQTLCEILEKAM